MNLWIDGVAQLSTDLAGCGHASSDSASSIAGQCAGIQAVPHSDNTAMDDAHPAPPCSDRPAGVPQ